MTRTEPFRSRSCRPAAADFGLCVIGACLAFAVQAADVPIAAVPPKPVVIQPAAAIALPPIPEAARQKTVKPASKPRTQVRKH